MFKFKKKIEPTPVAGDQLNAELIVHNMPPLSKLSGMFSGKSGAVSGGGLNSLTKPQSNFKAVGFLIMVLGLIFIGGLVYASYIFIIKPTANPSASAPAAVVSPVATTAPAITAPVATTTDTTPAPVAVDLATTTATTTATSTLSTDNRASNISAPADTDGDGLNDLEEAVLGTSATSSDTNHNSYTDLVEVLNNHNPLGAGLLSADPNLATYADKTVGYTILYPKAWPTQSVNNDATIIFTAPDNSLIQVSMQSNTTQADILTWYEGLFPNVTVGYDQIQSTATWDGIMGADNLNFYLTDKKHANVLVVSYIPAVTGNITYPNIFKMMINSLVIK